MADKKAPPASEDGHSVAYKIIFFAFLLMVLFTFLGKYGLDSYFNKNKTGSGGLFSTDNSGGTNSDLNKKEKLNFADFLFPKGKISLGGSIANKKEVEVRNMPAGQLLGLQKFGEIGKVLEGPVLKDNFEWWRIDYKNAPDGWVKDDGLTAGLLWFNILNFFPWLFGSLLKILILIGIIAFILIIIVKIKIVNLAKGKKEKEESKKEQDILYSDSEDSLPVPNLPIVEKPETENVTNRRWKNIQVLTQSHNLNDWKQAIIEADIMLDEMLDKMGYHGDSIGDKLKQIEASDFLTLNQAWEAHKVRNQIAHKGSNYVLSRDEAEKVIDLYSEVFREFYYI
jgi:hypothetical protein